VSAFIPKSKSRAVSKARCGERFTRERDNHFRALAESRKKLRERYIAASKGGSK
jgi:hypothetical protein